MRPTVLLLGCAGALAVSGCTLTEATPSSAPGHGTIAVTASDSGCRLTHHQAPSGTLAFSVTNTGSTVTEFYLYGADGRRIVGEVENIGPGLSRDLVVSAAPGTYVASCRPGMSGHGIRSRFAVTDSGRHTVIAGVTRAEIDTATASYAAYVKDQARQLVGATRAFTRAYVAGDDARARSLYPQARRHWERIETVAESFGDLDPRTDAREADLAPGQRWTGWHRIEKDLWPPATGYTPLSPRQRSSYAADLLDNIETLHHRVRSLGYSVDQIGNGSQGLMDEVATGKITGEEDVWSHTDLVDFQANVDGARVAYRDLRPLLEVKAPALSRTIAQRFAALQQELDTFRRGDGFVSYDTVGTAQRKTLSDLVNALSEPLAQMTGAITL